MKGTALRERVLSGACSLLQAWEPPGPTINSGSEGRGGILQPSLSQLRVPGLRQKGPGLLL